MLLINTEKLILFILASLCNYGNVYRVDDGTMERFCYIF